MCDSKNNRVGRLERVKFSYCNAVLMLGIRGIRQGIVHLNPDQRAASSRTISTTRVLRVSGTSSLKVKPSMVTMPPVPPPHQPRAAFRATRGPMPSLIRRPARMTSG